MESTLTQLFKHNVWANLRLLGACADLGEPQMNASASGTYGSVRDTLAHLVRSEENYVAMLTGEWPERPLNSAAEAPPLDELRERARASGERLVELADSIPPDRLLRGTYRGEAYSVRAVYVLLQAINHATEHRAHVSTIVSQQGLAVSEMDGWTYAREREAGVGR
jgi:uncharacterized damage-inducible protein DinB